MIVIRLLVSYFPQTQKVKVVRVLLSIALIVLGLSAIAGYYLIEGALHPAKRKLSGKAKQRSKSIASELNSNLQVVTIFSSDRTKLKGWYFESFQPSQKTVLLFHGLSDNRGGMLGYASFLLRKHYNVITPDWRAHGESEGRLATYGLNEINDVKAWLDWAEKEVKSKSYYALGESYGAAILLQSLEKEDRICAAVAESSFSSFREAAYDRLGQQVGAGEKLGRMLFFPVAESGFLTASWKYALDLHKVNPLESLRGSTTPVLLIHGDADSNLPVRHSRFMYSANKNRRNLEYWESPGVEHSSTHGKLPKEFELRVLNWFHKYDCNFNTKAPGH